MFLTSREQKLIQTFLKRGKLTIAEMMEITDTSRRTLYRDLNNLQKSLPENLSLENTDEGYFLKGDINQLTQAHELIDYSISERLYGELLLLIENKASIASLTDYFGISQPTVTSDLKQIEQALFENDLVLIRDRGLKLKGAEENIRPVFVAVIYNSASIQELLLNQFSNNKILRKIDLNKFKQVNEAFKRIDLPEKMTDKVKVLMQLFCLVVLLRLDEGYSVSSETLGRPSKQALNFVNKLLTELPVTKFVVSEITYLASVYDILYFGFGRELLFMEKFDTDFSYKIRQLIDKVSTILEIEFGKDDRLYGLLYAHLKESEMLPVLFPKKENDFIKKINKDNPEIYKTVKESLREVFDKNFSEMEIAFISLHFVATLERSDLVLPLSAALVSSRGRISCEFIMSNLRKNFPFLKKIELIQSSIHITQEKYDVIFTTEKELDYLYINPMLDQKNLENIRHQLRLIQQKSRALTSDSEKEKNFLNLNDLFSIGNEILKSFEILSLENKAELHDTVKQIIQRVNPEDSGELVHLVEERFKETHLAIPETKIALFHAVHSSISSPIFKIFDLSQPIEGIAMDHQAIQIERVLLLLAPPEVPEYVSFLLGKISSSIIENKLYTRIYDSGNYEIVSELLREIIIEAVKHYDD